MKTRAKIVVLCSIAIAGSAVASHARSLGADGVISKPSGSVSYDLEEKRGSEFWQVIHQLLGIETGK